jgi:hypothetical protein
MLSPGRGSLMIRTTPPLPAYSIVLHSSKRYSMVLSARQRKHCQVRVNAREARKGCCSCRKCFLGVVLMGDVVMTRWTTIYYLVFSRKVLPIAKLFRTVRVST